MKIAHIYASNAKANSGDYMLGIATKQYFHEKILNTNDADYTSLDCRDEKLYTDADKLNQYDCLLVGGGGLILSDSAPNKVSCWQWIIDQKIYDQLTVPIYVVSIGYNLFYGQTMNMSSREYNTADPSRMDIFKKNITKLIDRSTHFSMRHKRDIDNLCSIIGEEYRSKIKFEFCPTIWYAQTYWKPKIDISKRKYIAIEIKDDREWRRYHKIGKEKYYQELTNFVKHCLENQIPVACLTHDGSRNFYRHLCKHNIDIPYLKNNTGNETSILNNYSQIHTILCSAGHSQMMSYAIGIRIISLITHPKLRHFCQDINNHEYIEVNYELNIKQRLMQILF